MALIDPCLYLQADAHPARSFRAVITEMWDEGLMSLVDFRVTQRAAGANFTLDVSSGRAVVQGDSATLQGNYMVTNDATVNDASTTVTSAPSAGNTRYDILILEIKDNAEDAGGINAPRFRVVAGTPAAAGATPPATPVSSLLLATIGPIVNSTTTITNSLITQANIIAGRRDHVGKVDWLTGNIVPNGWLAADGSAVSRSTYPRLAAHYAAMSYPYGAGNGTTTFNLPDLRGKVALPVRAGQSQVDTIGETGGEYTHVQTVAEMVPHAHGSFTGDDSPDHVHGVDPGETQLKSNGVDVTVGNSVDAGATVYRGIGIGTGGAELTVDVPFTVSGGASPRHQHAVNPEGGGAAFNVMQPYQVVGLAVIRT